DVGKTPRLAMTSPVVMAAALLVARHHGVLGAPRTVAIRIGGPEQADRRRADSGRDVERTRVSRDDERRRARACDQIGHGRCPPQRRGPGRRVNNRRGKWFFARTPEDDWQQAALLAQERCQLAVLLRRPTLVRPRGSSVDEREPLLPCPFA